jgi:hypothetical protein
MNTAQQVWIPTGQNLDPALAQVLAVQVQSKPDYSLYTSLLARQIQKMVDEDKKEAKRLMEDYQPQIAMEVPMAGWGVNLVEYSDSMAMILNQIDWTQPGMLLSQTLPSLWEILEQLP